jgi:hypothetical protein
MIMNWEGYFELGSNSMNWEGCKCSWFIRCNSQHLPGLNGESKVTTQENRLSCGGSKPQSLEYV